MGQQSKQETLIREMTEKAFGGRYVFAPREYRKGNGTREPADLAWYGRDTVVLMYMTETDSGWERDRDHNLRQAKGWLRAWRHPQQQRSLTGDNHSRAFDVLFETSRAIVVLSVTADPQFAGIESHRGWANDNAVDECASVSNALMVEFARLSGSITDLVIFLRCWQKLLAADAGLSPIAALHSSIVAARTVATEHVGWHMVGPVSPELEWVIRNIRGLRGAHVKSPALLTGTGGPPLDFVC